MRDTLDENGNVILSDYTKKVGSGKKAQVISAPRTVPLSSAKSGKLFDDRERIGNFKFPFVHIGEGYYEYDSSKNNALVNLTTNVLDLTCLLYTSKISVIAVITGHCFKMPVWRFIAVFIRYWDFF